MRSIGQNKQFKLSLFVFRRDLRLEDNTGLIFALKSSEYVIPAFIFTPEQIKTNPFRSDFCLQFMMDSLQDLDSDLRENGGKLFLFQGSPEGVIKKCIQDLAIDAVVVNRDYTPYSQKRDQKIKKTCQDSSIPFYSFDDTLLHPPEETLKQDGKPYSIFTPYYRNASKQKVLEPIKNRYANYSQKNISFAEKNTLLKEQFSSRNTLKGGRQEGLKILKKLPSFKEYASYRDFPAKNYSTHLSPYLKFNVCSCREVYAAICKHLGNHHPLIRSLYWRDFFTCITFFFPHVFQGAFHQKFDRILWSNNKKRFERWCEGLTGFPLVDAGMRELKATGFMHNRVRMVTASFLIKDLHINWQWGEKYFAQTLIDYDPAVNNGNWQWVASTGCDAQPYFRIFNPWQQQKKFDPDCLYIKKWIPELQSLPSSVIHSWDNEKYHGQCAAYPPPMVEHKSAASQAVLIYKASANLSK